MNDMIKIEKDMTPKLIGETYMKYYLKILIRGKNEKNKNR
jgi:hypothetical protein